VPTLAIVPTGWIPGLSDIRPPIECSSANIVVRRVAFCSRRCSLCTPVAGCILLSFSRACVRLQCLPFAQYVPFSLHSSFAELREFVAAVRPRRLYSAVRGRHADLQRYFSALLDPSPPVRHGAQSAAASLGLLLQVLASFCLL
jgi:hypothetical protein